MPTGDYELDLHRANVVKEGSDITLIGWGNVVHTLKKVMSSFRRPHSQNKTASTAKSSTSRPCTPTTQTLWSRASTKQADASFPMRRPYLLFI